MTHPAHPLPVRVWDYLLSGWGERLARLGLTKRDRTGRPARIRLALEGVEERLVPTGDVLVNTYTTAAQEAPAIASDAAGNFVVVWQSSGQDGSGYGVYAQRYAADSTALGSEFRVNTYTTSTQGGPAVAMDADGNFVVAWHSDGQDGSGYGVYAQRYAADGT